MLQELSVFLTALDNGSRNEIDFLAWTRKTVTMCSTKAIYGPENPFNKYPELEKAFWFVFILWSITSLILTLIIGNLIVI